MVNRIFPKGFPNNSKNTLTNILLVTNAFVWYYFILDLLQNSLKTAAADSFATVAIWVLHFGGIAGSAIIGAKMIDKAKNRANFLTVWMSIGIASSIIANLLNLESITNLLITSFLLGISLGFGMPCCMGFFNETTDVERRGRVGGLILLLSGLGMVALGATTSGSIYLQKYMLLAWRAFGLVSFLLLSKSVKTYEEKIKAPSFRSIISKRPFVLYLIPWIMFSLITYLTVPIQSGIVGQSTVDSLMIVENVLIAVFAIIGGFLADIIGRKRISIFGFAMLGLGYSIIGIFPEEPFSMYFYTIADSVALGILFVVFVIVIWGDISVNTASDKYYAIGVLPFFISKFIQKTVGNNIATVVSPYALFSFTAFFLFIAVLPLFYAPETLPEKVMKDRDLKSYVEKAKKKVQKEAEKTPPKEEKRLPPADDQATAQPTPSSPHDEDAEYEEAKRLAEKYY
jgi:MFS family permease